MNDTTGPTYDDVLELPKLAARQGSLHWLGIYEVVPARTGAVMITPTPQAETLIEGEHGSPAPNEVSPDGRIRWYKVAIGIMFLAAQTRTCHLGSASVPPLP